MASPALASMRPNRLLIALVAGLAAGIAISAAHSPVLTALVGVVEPVGTLWVNAIRMTVVPLVVALLITGVASTADAAAVGKLGARTVATYAGLTAIAALLAVLVVPVLFRWLSVSAESTAALRATVVASAPSTTQAVNALPGFAQWLTNLVPTNPIRAAADGAMLPLVVFTLAFALAALRLPAAQRQSVITFFAAVGDTMLVIVRWVIAAAPIGIFALILPPAARLGVTIAGAIVYYMAAMAVALVVFTLVLYPVVRVAGRVSLAAFARAVLPAQTVAFSSSSSLASLPALIHGAERELAIPPAVSGFVLPLSVATFKACTPIYWSVAAMFVATIYGIHLELGQVATIALAGAVLGFSIPGVPNAALLVITPLFVNVGLPPEAVGLLIAADAIPDLFGTTANVTGDLAACAIVAARARR